MSLPKIATPEFECVLPSKKEKIKFRPFLMKEEKILYMALEGNDPKEILNSIINILSSCILTPGIKVTELASFDVEYLFLLLRSKSVGEIIDLKVKHKEGECSHISDVQLNIEDVKVDYGKNEKQNMKVNLGNGLGLMMQYPTIKSIGDINDIESEVEKNFDLICSCVQYVYDSDNVYEDFTKEELNEFISKLSRSQYKAVVEFFKEMPKLRHELKFTCEVCKKEDSIVLEGMQSFFV